MEQPVLSDGQVGRDLPEVFGELEQRISTAQSLELYAQRHLVECFLGLR
jgi:hypothetical protein